MKASVLGFQYSDPKLLVFRLGLGKCTMYKF